MCFCVRLVREDERENGPLADRAAGFDGPGMFLYDLMDNGQTQSGPNVLRALVFRGEEGVKDVGEILGGNSAAGIRDLVVNPSRLVNRGGEA